jgi:voltage-gated potassium channel
MGNILRHSRRAQFALLFVTFVLVGTMMIHLLEGAAPDSPFAGYFNDFWFTMVTVTTTGYGDLAPKLVGSRLWTILEMFVGVVLVGIITGSIASALVEGNRRHALGLAPLRNIREHIVVCGWKRDMRNILLGILQAEPSLTSWDLVLVTAHPASEIADLRREPGLRGLHYVYGSHTDRSVLEMAQVRHAQRVIILADEAGRHGGSDPDARTVLAATAVEAISGEVYTCTEIVRPHYVDYLRPARVEEVVLEASNARALLVTASLGDGLATVMTRLLPEHGQQLRVLDIPALLVGEPYETLEHHAFTQGYLPVGLLENTGRLYDRQQERIREALHVSGYRQAVDELRLAAHLVSNVPVLTPPKDQTVRPYSKLLVLIPSIPLSHDTPRQQNPAQRIGPRAAQSEKLVVCGWKPDMAELLGAIRERHAAAGRPLAGLTVAANLPKAEVEALAQAPSLKDVLLTLGEPTDPAVLRRAGIGSARRVLILGDPVTERSPQEADARNIMISFAVNELNPAAYKCVELVNASFEEHLRVGNVEEPVYTGRYQRLMLVQASLGTGLASAVGALFDPAAARLRVVDFLEAPPEALFGRHARAFAARGMLLIGVMEDAGSGFLRKAEYARKAQAQADTRQAVAHLLHLKRVRANVPVIHPGADYRPGPYARALVVAGAPVSDSPSQALA